MPGYVTAPGRSDARADAPDRVAFRPVDDVGARENTLSRLDGWPMRSPVNASPLASRPDTHDSGQCGSLLLHCNGLAPSTPCRSPGAPTVVLAYSAPMSARRRRARSSAGDLRRGEGRTIRAVLLLGDLRGFTRLTEQLPSTS